MLIYCVGRVRRPEIGAQAVKTTCSLEGHRNDHDGQGVLRVLREQRPSLLVQIEDPCSSDSSIRVND